ncbi:MAG: SOS response-associated peptidase [Pseudomonadota bacterium]
MCGRYYLKSTPQQLSVFFGCDVRDNFPPRYNIAPTQPIALVRQSEQRKREYALARWGFIPSSARKVEGKPLINARSETAAEKPSFRSAYKRRRCLIPADGFYEWKALPGGGKQPFAIERRDGAMFAFAGIWETACDPDGGEVDTAAILTADAGSDLRGLYHREPVVIAPEHFALWLEGDERDLALLAPLLAPAPKATWAHHEVSSAVNAVRNDGPQLIEPEQPLPLFA